MISRFPIYFIFKYSESNQTGEHDETDDDTDESDSQVKTAKVSSCTFFTLTDKCPKFQITRSTTTDKEFSSPLEIMESKRVKISLFRHKSWSCNSQHSFLTLAFYSHYLYDISNRYRVL